MRHLSVANAHSAHTIRIIFLEKCKNALHVQEVAALIYQETRIIAMVPRLNTRGVILAISVLLPKFDEVHSDKSQ